MKITGILLLAVLIAAMVSVVMGEGWAADEKEELMRAVDLQSEDLMELPQDRNDWHGI